MPTWGIQPPPPNAVTWEFLWYVQSSSLVNPSSLKDPSGFCLSGWVSASNLLRMLVSGRPNTIKSHQYTSNHIKWMFPKIGVSPNGWFIMENPIKGFFHIFGSTPKSIHPISSTHMAWCIVSILGRISDQCSAHWRYYRVWSRNHLTLEGVCCPY